MLIKLRFSFLFTLLLLLVERSISLRCDRTPEGARTPRTQTGHNYVIEISGNPDTYVPGEQYTIFLRSNRDRKLQNKFKDFLLLIEHEQSERSVDSVKNPSVGTLQLYGDMLTKFSETCRNGVVQTNSLPKSEIQVLWLAPVAASGCVAIRATVVESSDVWYSEDGNLSKILCEEISENDDIQPNVMQQCCACDEAKYEITFEGMWSRNTHPKDFPQNEWSTRFSDIIGASHTVDYTFWNYGDIASEGLRQLAENGNTRMLESELKAKSEHIRTIIKARGISYPNITGRTFAVFRVDNRHHLISLVSKLDPSPDWLVGVSSLELCLRNCTWVESRILNLYPWDAGTDDGVTYTAPNQPSTPRQSIRRIKSNSPNDPRSPFYDSNGGEVKPLAKLYLSRQRLYEKTCDVPLIYSEENPGVDHCEVGKWSEWSQCSVTCGKGVKYRQRAYKNPYGKKLCARELTQRASCRGSQRECPNVARHQTRDDPECELSDWGEWSTCSMTCGIGVKTRSRRYRNRSATKKCAAGLENPPLLEQTLECGSVQKTCEREEDNAPNCPYIQWSNWSPCSVTCGEGTKKRTRIYHNPNPLPLYYGKYDEQSDENNNNHNYEEDDDDDESDPCPHITEQIVQCMNDENPICNENPEDRDVSVCGLTKDVGGCRNNIDRWYFNTNRGYCEIFTYSGCEGNRNNFKTLELCERICKHFQLDNKTSSPSSSSMLTQRKHHHQKNSAYVDYQNDEIRTSTSTNIHVTERSFRGIDSWSHTIYTNNNNNTRRESVVEEPWGPVINCEVSKWTSWSTCNVTDGECGNGYRVRYRHINIHPMNGGRPCPRKLFKKKKCEVPCDKEEKQSQEEELRPIWGDTKVHALKIDCVMSPWSAWSPCSQSCGANAVQQRTRSIIRPASGRGKQCEHRVEQKHCPLLACPE